MAHAEIPTREAAQAFAAYAGQFPELDALLLRVEAAGFPLGVEGRLRCFVVLSRLTSLGTKPGVEQLIEHLLPVLATSRHEQLAIRLVIQDWASAAAVRPAPSLEKEEVAAPREVRRFERADRTGTVLAAGLATAAVLVFASLVVMRVLSGGDPTTAATSVVTYSQPVLSLDFGLDPFWKRVIEDTLSRLGFAAVVLMAGLTFAAWRSEVKGRLVRQNEETDLVEPFRIGAEIPKWFRNADARAAFDRLKRVRLFETELLDVPRTIAASARAGGLPLLATRRQRELPTYVLLVDRAARDDLAGIFARAVEAALIEARIVYTRYDFSGGLDRLNPVRGGAQGDIVDAEYLPFSVIASRHSGERLILIGTGTGFFEFPGFRYDRHGRRTLVRPGTPLPGTIHVREFGAAFAITPAPVSAWGENERRLRDLGFEIFSADVQGVQNLAAQLASEPGAEVLTLPRSNTDEDRFILRLDRDATRLSATVPPSAAEIERLVRNLKIWAREDEVYTLLAAIAAFPKIDSAFTFVLARMVFNKEMDSALFARLVRLPWIRNGYVPDWLRIAIVNGLDPEQRRTVQAIQMTMLQGAEQQEQGEGASLDRLVANFQVARELPRGRLEALISRIQPRPILSADERIFFSVLRDYQLDPELDVIRPEAPEIVADMIEAPERRRRAQIRFAVFGLAALAAVLQPWIWMALTAAGTRAAAALQAAQISSPSRAALETVFRVEVILCLLGALTSWYVNLRRDEPIVFASSVINLLLQPIPRLLQDPRVLALSAATSVPFLFIFSDATPLNLANNVILLAAACAVFAWVSVITPARWWNTESADDRVKEQIERDPVTGTAGVLFVAAIWALSWFLIALPQVMRILNSDLLSSDIIETGAEAGAESQIVSGMLFFSGFAVMVASAASSALARRWLIGKAWTGPLYRLWMDAGFALVVFLTFASLAGVGSPVYSMLTSRYELLVLLAIGVAAPLTYGLQLQGTLGLRRAGTMWGSLISGGMLSFIIVFSFTVILIVWRLEAADAYYRATISFFAFGAGLAGGASAIFRLRKSGDRGPSSNFWIKGVALAGILFAATVSLSVFVIEPRLEILQRAIEDRHARDFLTVLVWFLLPASLMIWPMFLVLSLRSPAAHASTPRWRAIIDSPWCGTLAMWLAGVSLRTDTVTFSVWPLALLVAIFLRRRYGERALVPIVVGTLPLLVRFGDVDTTFYTPGGFWPAIAIVFLARFAADAPFRQRWLRREHLSWLEAFLIVVPLTAHLDLSLGESIVAGVPSSIHADPGWILAAAAFVIGASRMPASRFAAAVIAGWLVLDIPFLINDRPSFVNFIGVPRGEAASTLLVLYGARAWRTYAASGAGSRYVSIAGGVDRRLARMKRRGLNLAYGAVLSATILASGLIPAVRLPRTSPDAINYLFIPGIAGTLALAVFTGLIAGNLLADKVMPERFVRFFRRHIERPSPFSSFALAAAAIAPFYIVLAVFGRESFAAVGVGINGMDSLPDLGLAGFLICVAAYLALGIGLRIAAERHEDESWRDAARRLWKAPPRDDPDSRAEDPSPEPMPSTSDKAVEAETAEPFRRPSDWHGHWSARYGKVLARTINRDPPFRQRQSELLEPIPHPMREALDPIASSAEPIGRDGKLAAWRLRRSAAFDLFGPTGLVAGALVFAIVSFNVVVPLFNLPPLLAPAQEQPAPVREDSPGT